MQNFHDGVGSQLVQLVQLVMSLTLVRQGIATQADVAGLLQDCLDDMGLALDSLSAEGAELFHVLGSLRARIAPRFNAMGLRLDWISENLPEALQLGSHVTLQVLRILQEALADILKRAEAGAVTTWIGVHIDLLHVVVKDDGLGMTTAFVDKGQGLRNMKVRAEKVGGTRNTGHR
jgi:glucose-6-phosphate-specific signal transduction histidine kinase